MKISQAYSLYFLTAVPIFANILNNSEIKASSLFFRKLEVIKQNIRIVGTNNTVGTVRTVGIVEIVRGGSGPCFYLWLGSIAASFSSDPI
jgi:hypothetical protein